MIKVDTNGITPVKWANGKRYVMADLLSDTADEVTDNLVPNTNGEITGEGVVGLTAKDILVQHSTAFTADCELLVLDSENEWHG